MDRRASDTGKGGGQGGQFTKVVGFHVEGMAESPGIPRKQLLTEEMHHVGSGPLPVIIPVNSSRPAAVGARMPSQQNMVPIIEGGDREGSVAPLTIKPVDETSPIRQSAQPVPTTPSSGQPPRAKTATPEAPVSARSMQIESSAAAQGTTGTGASLSRNASKNSIVAEPEPSTPSGRGGDDSASSGAQAGAQGEERRPGKPNMSAMTRAERRAYQDAQRAAKAAAKEGGPAAPAPAPSKRGGEQPPSARPSEAPSKAADEGSSHAAPTHRQNSTVAEKPAPSNAAPSGAPAAPREAPAKKKNSKADEPKEVKRPALFAHLPVVSRGRVAELVGREAPPEVHPAVVQLARAYGERSISGSNARVVALLYAIKTVVQDHLVNPGAFGKGLLTRINDNIKYLIQFRPLSLAMGNAIKYVKAVIAQARERNEEEAGQELMEAIDNYVRERVIYADEKCIFVYAMSKIRQQGDVILTFAYSHAVFGTLQAAHKAGKSFRVVVVDSRPGNEGRLMLRKLLQLGISCTYTHVGALSYIMKEATLVLLGAAAVLSNGSIISRAGTALVAMMANMVESRQVPVLVCCETHKFHERVQNDSITYNELGDPSELVRIPGRPDAVSLDQWEGNDHLHVLNLTYDLTPAHLVSVIVTELGLLPPSSVPVVLRERLTLGVGALYG